jgi:predicted O-methyltransferase YrrM
MLPAMSHRTTAVDPGLLAYLAVRTAQEDRVLVELRAAAVAAGLPEIWIAPEQASLLAILVRAAGARTVVEVGTLAGYSAIWLARALPAGGRLHTIELEPKCARFARTWLQRAGVADRVEVHEGDARAVLPRFAAASVDVVFVDADKEGYPVYLEQGLRILRPGGLFLADNAFAFGEVLAPGSADAGVAVLRRFNDLVAARADLQAVIVPLGDGCWVGVKTEDSGARAR